MYATKYLHLPSPTNPPSTRRLAPPRSTRVRGRFVQEESGAPSTSSFEWTDSYAATPIATYHTQGELVTLPVMPLKKVKVLTDTVQLNVFEPRYRTMFRLVKRSSSRVFGVTLREANGISSVGVLCELTHFVPVVERKSIFVSSRVIGRFDIESLVHSKPFLCAHARTLYDDETEPSLDSSATSETEEATWKAMCDVRALVGSLTGSLGSDNEAFSLEVRRWSPRADVRDTVAGSISSHPQMLAECRRAGLMGDANPTPVTSVSRESLHCEDAAVAYVTSEARMEADERARRRAEKMSFALARSLDLDDDVLLGMLLLKSTDERLEQCGAVIAESEKYLRARSALQQLNLDN